MGEPRVQITEDNYLYVQLLDAIANKEKVPFDALHPETIILNYIKDNKLDCTKQQGKQGNYGSHNYHSPIDFVHWSLFKD